MRELPFSALQLRPQPAVTRMPLPGLMTTGHGHGLSSASVSFSYTLWRHPDDHSDPRNEIEMDASTQHAIENEPPWGRPAWASEQLQVFRYPWLWEATRTIWHAEADGERTSVRRLLVDHMNHILHNRFRTQLGLPSGPLVGPDAHRGDVTMTGAVDAPAIVEGVERAGVQIDTDPFVYGIGFRIDEHVVCTSVIPRRPRPRRPRPCGCRPGRPRPRDAGAIGCTHDHREQRRGERRAAHRRASHGRRRCGDRDLPRRDGVRVGLRPGGAIGCLTAGSRRPSARRGSRAAGR